MVFKRAPNLLFRDHGEDDFGQNAVVIRVQPDEGATIRFGSKVPGTQMEVRDVTMDFGYGHSFTESSPEAYERLILDVLLGEPPLFPRHEEVELSWKILDPFEDYWAGLRRTARTLRPGVLGPRLAPMSCWPVTDEPGEGHDRRPAGHHHLEDLQEDHVPARAGRRDRPGPGPDPGGRDPVRARGRSDRGRERGQPRTPLPDHRPRRRRRRGPEPARRADPGRRGRRRLGSHRAARLRRTRPRKRVPGRGPAASRTPRSWPGGRTGRRRTPAKPP